MLRNWRTWVLMALLIVPLGVYVAAGSLWLLQHGWEWLLGVTLGWILSYGLMAFLADRWTRSARPLLPPLDWKAPRTFTSKDREAWSMVEQMAKRSDEAAIEQLSSGDIYINTGRELAYALARHYHPKSKDPIDNVPVVELLTALELAAEDLGRLCREVPGGDIITPGHWKQGVQAANFVSKANEVYGYLMPLFSPVGGLARLGVQKLVAQPAWKNVQRSMMRWFFRAFVNRLGHHLVELYSGRLSIGADHYRSLTRKAADRAAAAHEEASTPVVAVAGAEGSGKSLLIAALEKAIGDRHLEPVRRRLTEAGREPELADRLANLRFLEVPGYRALPGSDTARERSSRRDAVDAAAEGDLLVLVADASRGDLSGDLRFIREWAESYADKPTVERPPGLVLVTGFGSPEDGGGEDPPGGRLSKDEAIAALKSEVPEGVRVVAVELEGQSPASVAETVLPPLARRIPEAERVALLRHLHRHSSRSKARRVFNQLGKQGKRLWGRAKSKIKGGDDTEGDD